MDWVPYKSCCLSNVSSLDPDVGFCPECGHPLMRCLGFADCRKLISPREACPGCVAPQLMIKAGAIVGDKAGHRMSVPLILLNQSSAGVLVGEADLEMDGRNQESLTIPFEHVDAHEEREFSLDTAALAEGGTYTLNLRLVLAARYKNVEEEYAFAAGITVSAATQEQGNKIYNTNIGTGDVEGSGAAGHMIGAPINIGSQDKTATATALADKQPVRLQRAERYEIEQGIRGYRKESLRVLRNVDFAFSGFRPEDIPSEPPALIASGRLLFGRNSRPPVPEHVTANDVCLRAFDPKAKESGRAGDDGDLTASFRLRCRKRSSRGAGEGHRRHAGEREDAHRRRGVPDCSGRSHHSDSRPRRQAVATRGVQQRHRRRQPHRREPVHHPFPRTHESRNMNRAKCNAPVPADADFCPECGHRKEAARSGRPTGASRFMGAAPTFNGLETIAPIPDRPTSVLETGSLFADRYEIVRRIGAGAMGVVYLAKDAHTSEQLVLKLIHPDLVHGEEAVKRLIAEGLTARQIRSPKIVAVYDVAQHDGQPYFTMEYVGGGNLRTWMTNRWATGADIALATAVGLMKSMLAGIAEAHRMGIVHRDQARERAPRRQPRRRELRPQDSRFRHRQSRQGAGECWNRAPDWHHPVHGAGADDIRRQRRAERGHLLAGRDVLRDAHGICAAGPARTCEQESS